MSCGDVMSNERGFELGRHVLPDGRSFTVKRHDMKYAEVYVLQYQGQEQAFRPENFDKAKAAFDLQAPLRLGGNDAHAPGGSGSEEGRGDPGQTVRGSDGEGDNRGRSESD